MRRLVNVRKRTMAICSKRELVNEELATTIFIKMQGILIITIQRTKSRELCPVTVCNLLISLVVVPVMLSPRSVLSVACRQRDITLAVNEVVLSELSSKISLCFDYVFKNPIRGITLIKLRFDTVLSSRMETFILVVIQGVHERKDSELLEVFIILLFQRVFIRDDQVFVRLWLQLL